MPVGGVTTRRNITPSSTKSPKDSQKDSQKESPSTSDSSPKSTKGKSMQTTMDVIQTQLTEINEELKKTVKVSDIRTIVKGVVEELFSNYEKKMNEEVSKLKEENEKLNQENKELRKEVRNQDQALNEMNNRLEVNERMTKSAMSKANFNEQYSRKNNIKFYGVTEHKGEELLQTVNTVLDQVGERIDKSDVLAMHRIPGKKDQPRPIIVKLRSSETKTAVMKKRSDIKRLTLENDGKVKVSDDVTQDNTALISRLLQDHRISAAWYFNGSIYGQCGQRRMKFDIFDDIDQKIRKK